MGRRKPCCSHIMYLAGPPAPPAPLGAAKVCLTLLMTSFCFNLQFSRAGGCRLAGGGCRRAAGSRIQRIGHLAGAGPAPAARERGAAWGKWRGLAREHGPGGSVSGRTRRARSEPQRYRLRQALSAEARLGPPSTQQHRAALRPGHAGLRGAGSPDVGAGALQPRRAGPMPCHAMPWLAVTGDYVEPPTPRHS